MSNLRQAIEIVQPGQTRTRKTRTPSFPIAGGFEPFGLYPYFAHPVLPGETLDRHSLKSTVVSAPVANPLAGAWLETWLFYVRLTDMHSSLGEMFIGTLTDKSPFEAESASPRFFSKAGQIDWIRMATERVHEVFFRDEGEEIRWLDGVPVIKRINSDFTESAIQGDLEPGDVHLPGGEEIFEQLTPQQHAMLQMRQMGLGVTSYEDYLKTFNVSPAKVAQGEPELLAYRRYWTLPSNVINPADGSPSGAWYWRVDEANEKPKRFLEPGFIIGFQACRPKVYDGTQKAAYTNELWGFADWIPSYTLDAPEAGIREWDPTTQRIFEGVGESETSNHPLYIDHRDLFSHGEQFVNGAGRFDRPVSTFRNFEDDATEQELRAQYVTEADITAMWAAPDTTRGLDYEGITQLVVKGHIQDNT